MTRLDKFTYRGDNLQVTFVESLEVFEGVVCDVYVHPETNERDLGVIYISAGKRTKPQKVLNGKDTIEGYISGKGRLCIKKADGSREIYEVGPDKDGFSCIVDVEDIMQWQADTDLVVYEICFPPYVEGRYANLEDSDLRSS